MYFNHVTRLYYCIYIRLLCEPDKKAMYLLEDDHKGGHTIMHVQTHVQLSVQYQA